MKQINIYKSCSFGIFLFINLQLSAQTDSLVGKTESSFGVVCGAGYNGNATSELAIGIQNRNTLNDTNTYNMQTISVLGSELYFTPGEVILAPKFTLMVGFNDFVKAGMLIFPMTSGLSLLYPTNFSEGSFCLRLEYGIPFKQARLYYGYTIPFSNKEFIDGMRHSINFSLFLRTGKKHVTREYYNKETETFYELNVL